MAALRDSTESDIDQLGIRMARTSQVSVLGCFAFVVIFGAGFVGLVWAFAPGWAFWPAVLAFALVMLPVAISLRRQHTRMGVYLREARGEWKNGKPKTYSSEQVEEICRNASEQARDLHLRAAAYMASLDVEGELDPSSATWMQALEVFNQFAFELDQLRTAVRTLLPTVTPTDIAVVERVLTEDIELLQQIRQECVYPQSPDFVRVVLDRVPLDPFDGRTW